MFRPFFNRKVITGTDRWINGEREKYVFQLGVDTYREKESLEQESLEKTTLFALIVIGLKVHMHDILPPFFDINTCLGSYWSSVSIF